MERYKKTKVTLTLMDISIVALGLTAACAGCRNRTKAAEKEMPNFILLMGDDHGWDEVGYNGHPYLKTPVLDEMAAEGFRFDRFYSGHSTSSPTRGSVITGRHPNRYGTFTPGFSIRPEEISIADIVKAAGYATGHFGKWHVGPVKKDSPTNPGAMGFDEWFSHDNFFELNPCLSRNGGEPQKTEGESSEVIIDAAIQFIEKAKRQKKPFLAVVWFGSPHEPYSGLPQDLALYDNLPDSLNNIQTGLTSNETGLQVTRPLRNVLRERYAEITAMDRAIGKLRIFLKENGLRNNTMVLYCGDNGTSPDVKHTCSTLRGQKGTLYEGGIRVPAVMEWPAGIKKPASSSVVTVTSDLLPTIAELTGQPLPPRPVDGISMVPFLKDTAAMRPQSLCFWMFNVKEVFGKKQEPYIDPVLQEGTTPLVKKANGKNTRDFKNFKYTEISENDFSGERAIFKNQYKLILGSRSSGNDGVELYNIENDSRETANIADKHPGLVKEMKAELRSWQESVLNSLTGADYK